MKILALTLALLLAGCTTGSGPEPGTATPSAAPQPSGQARSGVLATGLNVPWGVTVTSDGLVFTERDTRKVRRLGPGGLSEIAQIDDAAPGGEGGLLGVAADPEDLRIFYVYYTSKSDNRVVKVEGTGQTPILTGIPKGGRHNGGALAFGPDGYLYVATGDAGDTSHAQDLESLGGKILRLTKTGGAAPGNKYGQVYSYGHRNVQGMAWHEDDLYATEFGQNTWDEVNKIVNGGNYGWPIVEGKGNDERYQDPIAQWHTDEASCSGAAVVEDTFYAGCLRGERVWAVPLIGGEPRALKLGLGRIRLVANWDGQLIVGTSNKDGRGKPRAGDDQLVVVKTT